MGSDLTRLAYKRFPKLSQAEKKVLSALPTGEWTWCGPIQSRGDPTNDPQHADKWGTEREVRAELLVWLCTSREVRDYVHRMGIQIYAANISGFFNLPYAKVPFPISLEICQLTDVNLSGAEIPELSLSGSLVRNSFSAWQIDVKGSVFLDDGFQAKGLVELAGAKIGGVLDCSGGIFTNPYEKDVATSGTALKAHEMAVTRSVFLMDGFRAEGFVDLRGCKIGGALNCTGGTFLNPQKKDFSNSGRALAADSIEVNEVFFADGFKSNGVVRLVSAQIKTNLNCRGGTFFNPAQPDLANSGIALNARQVTVGNGVYLGDGFSAEGIVNLSGAQIGGPSDFARGRFEKAHLYLEDVSARAMFDDEASWPNHGNLVLDGFVYARISAGPMDVESRLRWLGLQSERPFKPQPYLQLARVIKESGNVDGSRMVLEEMEHQRRRVEDHTYAARLVSWILRESIGYGYNPVRAAWEIAGLSALGWIIYRRSYLAGTIVPTDKEAYQAFKSDGRRPDHYPSFAPLIYSVENSLPLVTLGQVNLWRPDPASEQSGGATACIDSAPVPEPKKPATLAPSNSRFAGLGKRANRFAVLIGLRPAKNDEILSARLGRAGTSPKFLLWFTWIQILIGWLLATLFLAGITGIIRKD